MVEFTQAKVLPTARAAGQVSTGRAESIQRLAGTVQGVANKFTEYYEGEAQVTGDLLLAEIQELSARAYKARAANAGRGFANAALSDFDKLKEEKIAEYRSKMAELHMANVPERNMREIDASLSKYRMRLETRARAQEQAAIAAAAAKARAKANAAARRAAATAKRLRANALLSDPGSLQAVLETVPEKDHGYYIKTALSAEVRNDPAGVGAAMQEGKYDAHLSPSEKLSFMKLSDSGIKAIERENEIELNNLRKSFEADLEENIAFAAANGAPPVDDQLEPEAIQKLYESDPKRGQEVMQAYDDAVRYAETYHAVSVATPAELDLKIEELQAKVATPGNTKQDVQRLNDYVSAIGKRNQAIKDDAAGYVVQTEDTISQMYDLTRTGIEEGNEDAPIMAETYTASIDSVYDKLGVPVGMRTYLPKAAAQNEVAKLNASGTDVAPQILQGLVETWGAAAPRVISQLEKEGLSPAYSVALRHTDNPGLTQAIMETVGLDVAELKSGMPSASSKDAMAALDEGLVDYRIAFETAGGSAAVQTLNKHYEVAEKLTLKLVRGGVAPEDAASRVIGQMFPETVVSGNNENYILPVGLSERTIGRGTDYMMGKDFLKGKVQAIDDPRFPDFADLEVTIAAASRSGFWVNNSDGSGLQLMVSVDGYLVPLYHANGGVYSYTFREIESMGTPVPGADDDGSMYRNTNESNKEPVNTGLKSSHGRVIWEAPSGERYSEKTITIQNENGEWVNVPTIDGAGNQLPHDEVERFFFGNPDPIDPVTGERLEKFKTLKAAERAAKKRSREIKVK